MSSQHKLYDYQVTPPAETWNRIAGELEELQQLKPLGQQLKALEVIPPAHTWDTIAEHLKEEHSFNHLSERLTSLEVPPPDSLWSKIASELNTAVPVTQPAPVKKVNFRWPRYAVAACILGLLGFGIFHMVERSDRESKNLADLFEKKEKEQQQPKNAPFVAKSKIPAKPAHAHDENHSLADSRLKPTQIRTASGNTYNTTVEKNKALQGRYIMLMTEDGNVVRMSKKLGNMADCVAGEAAGNECNYQIEQWQKELAKAPVAATPDNFLDLLALANNEIAGL